MTQIKSIITRVNESLYKEVLKRASEQDRSISNYVKQILEKNILKNDKRIE